MTRFVEIFIIVLLLCAQTLFAQLIEEFQVNDNFGLCEKKRPASCMDKNGRTIIVWEDMRNGIPSIYGQIYDAGGNAVGSNFMVYEQVDAEPRYPDVDMDSTGRFVVCWLNNIDKDIYLQRMDAQGTRIQDPVRLIEGNSGMNLGRPAIAVFPNGNFVISCGNDHGTLFVQEFDEHLSAMTSLFVLDEANGDCGTPDIAIYETYYSIVWVRGINEPPNSDIYYQKLRWGGEKIGNKIKLNDDVSAYRKNPYICTNSNGQSLVVWGDSRNGEWSTHADIYGQLVTQDERFIVENIKISENTIYVINRPRPFPTIDSNGNDLFYVSWIGREKIDDYESVFFQPLDTTGRLVGSNSKKHHGFWKQKSTIHIFNHQIYLIWDEERTFVEYNNSNQPYQIFYQILDTLSTPVIEEKRVNDDDNNPSETNPYFAVIDKNNLAFMVERDNSYLDSLLILSINNDIIKRQTKFNTMHSADPYITVTPYLLSTEPNTFLAVWSESNNYGAESNIYLRKYDANGNIIKDNIKVNEKLDNAYNQIPFMAGNRQGKVVVVWNNGYNDYSQLYCQVYDKNLNKIGNNMQVSNRTFENDEPWLYNGAQVAVSENDDFMIIWWDRNRRLHASLFDQQNTVVKEDFLVASSGLRSYPGIVALPNGNYAIVYDHYDSEGNVYLQYVDEDGEFIGDPIQVNDVSGVGLENRPDLACDEKGNVIIVWSDKRDGDRNIYGQYYSSAMYPIGSNFRLNSDTGSAYQFNPKVELKYNRLYTCWEDNRISRQGMDIYARVDTALLDFRSRFLASHSPMQNENSVSCNTDIEVTFKKELLASSLNNQTIIVQGSQSGLHQSSSISYDSESHSLRYDPNQDFFNGERVHVTLTRDIQLADGGKANLGYTWSFTVEAGEGTGKFDKTLTYAQGDTGYVEGVQCADFDGDLDIDLSVYMGNVRFYLNQGDGTFPKVNHTQTPGGIIAIADLNRDGFLDFATPYNTNVNVRFGNGDGSFMTNAAYVIGESGADIETADLNQDGFPDLAVVNQASNTLSVLLNNGDGTFAQKVDYQTGEEPIYLEIADIDNDGNMDVLVNNVWESVSIFKGWGDGTLFLFRTTIIQGCHGICLVDLNEDQYIDLAALNRENNTIGFYENSGNGIFHLRNQLETGDSPHDVKSADFDGDGNMDICVVNHYDRSISIYKNNGNFTFSERNDFTTGVRPMMFCHGDFDGDGDLDIAVPNNTSHDMTILFNQESAADITIFNDSLRFAPQELGHRKSIQRYVYNYGTESTLEISEIHSSDSSFTIQPQQVEITPEDSLLFNITFEPRNVKLYDDSLTFVSNDPFHPQTSLYVSGEGVNRPLAVTKAPTNITQTTAVLQGSVNPQGKLTTVTFEYGTSTAYGSVIEAEPAQFSGMYELDVSAEIDSLWPNTDIHYRVVATNEVGTRYGEDQSFVTKEGAPLVTTLSATNVDTTSAVLHGLVNPLGKPTRVVFEYGQSENYGSEIVATPDTVNGVDQVEVSARVTGLSKNNVYHFRVKAINDAGTSYGQDESLTTASVSAVVVTNAATAVSTSSATLNAEVNPLGLSTEVRFLYGTTVEYGNTAEATPNPIVGTDFVPVSANLTGLKVNETYHFCIEAENSAGISRGSDQTFSTSPSAPAVNTLTAADIDTNAVTLRATVNPRGQSTTAMFEYGTTVAYGATIEADQSPVSGTSEQQVSVRLTGLSQNTVYHYRVVASNASGTMTGSNQSFMPSISKPMAETLPVSDLSMTGCTVHGVVNPKGRSVTVNFQYSEDLSFNHQVSANASPVDGSEDVFVSATLAGLQSNTTYYVRVMATNGLDTTFASGQTFTTLRDNLLPAIAPIAVSNATYNQSQTISAILSDNVGIESAWLNFRQGGIAAYDSSQMSLIGGDNYEGIIPSSVVTERGVEYFLAVYDSAGNRATYPKLDAGKNPRILRVSNSNLPFASEIPAQAYRMISIPFDLDNANANNVLADDLGGYDIKKWRLFRHVQGTDVEYGSSGFSTFKPGTGFWLISKEGMALDAGSGKSVSTSQSYVITLAPGWNQIGNPFAFPVAWDDVTKDESVESQLVGYAGSGNAASGYDYTRTVLQPWEGYFVNNTASDQALLVIPPREAESLQKRLPDTILTRIGENEWGVQIVAESDKYIDKDNYCGCLQKATSAVDSLDFSEAPLLQHHLSLEFENGLTADFRPHTATGQCWQMKLRGEKQSRINFSIEQSENFPKGWSLCLLDETCGIKVDLTETPGYSTLLTDAEQHYRLLAGSEDYIQSNDQGYERIPLSFELYQNYPNPFNPSTHIEYDLPHQCNVCMMIFNTLGQRVKTVINKEQAAGHYQTIWDGTDDSLQPVSAGMYLVYIRAETLTKVRKLLLVR